MSPDPFSEERKQLLSDVASAQLQARRSVDKARALQEQITMERGIWARERSHLLKKIAETDDEILKNSKRNSVTQQDTIEPTAVIYQLSSSLPATPRVLSTTSRSSISTSSLDLETAVMRYKASEAECQRLRSRIEILEKRLREKISTVTDKTSTTTTTTTTPHNSTKNAVGSSTMKRSAILSTPNSTSTPSTTDSMATSELLARVLDAERSKQEAIDLLRDVTNEAKKQSQEVKRLTEKINQYETTNTNANNNTSMATAPYADNAITKTPVRTPAQPPLPPPSAIVSAIALPYTPRRAAAHISQSFSSRINAATLATTPRLSSTGATSLPIFSTPKRTTSNSGTNSKSLFISKSPAAAKIPLTCARAKALEYALTRVPNPVVLSATRDSSKVFSSAVAAIKTTLNSSTSKDRARMHEEMTKNEQLQRFKSHEQRRTKVQEAMSSMPPPLPSHELQKLEQEAIKSASSIRVTSFEMKPRSATSDGFSIPSWLAKLPNPNSTSSISAGATIAAITRDGSSSGSERHFEAF